MKLKRTKLAALAMSALMAVSAFSPYVYAEEEEAAEAVTEVAVEAEAEETEAVDTPATVEETVYTYELTDITYGSSSITAKVTAYNEDGKASFIETITGTGSSSQMSSLSWTVTYTAATCSATGKIKIVMKDHNGTQTLIDTTLSKTAHTEKVTSTARYLDADGNVTNVSCSDVAQVQYRIVCSVCGAEIGWTDAEMIDGAAHVWTTSVAVAETSSVSNIVVGSKAVTVGTSTEKVGSDGLKTGTFSGSTTLYYATLDSSRNVQLADPEYDGHYYLMHTCTLCGETVYEYVTEYSTQAAYAEVISFNGVEAFWIDGNRLELADLAGRKFTTSLTTDATSYETLPDYTDVELSKCTEAGTYTIQYYNKNGVALGTQKVSVAAHHMTINVAVFDSQTDMDLCTISYATDGSLIVESSVCYPTITYTEVTECYAENCPLTACSHTYEKHVEVNTNTNSQVWNGIVSGVVYTDCTYTEVATVGTGTAKTGSHTWLGSVYRSLNSYVNSIDRSTTKLTTDMIIAKIAVLTDDDTEDYVAITADTSTCTTSGTLTVTFYCTTEPASNKTVVYTYTVDVDARGHKDGGVTVENYVAATCEQAGSYDKVHKCTRCDYEYEDTVSLTIPRLAHTNEIDGSYNASDDDYTNDSYNNNGASTIYIEVTGDRVVDYGSSLLNASAISTTKTKVKFTNSTGTIYNLIGGGNEGDSTLGVTVRVYTLCENCGGNKVYLDGDNSNTSSGLSVTVDAIQAQDTNGANGYITLTFSYKSSSATVVGTQTKTFNYYTSSTAYNGRVDKDTAYDPDVTTMNGIYLVDGVYKYYVNNEWVENFNGIVEYNGEYYFVANGVLCTDANGLALYNGDWYMLAYGKIQSDYTGVTIYDGETFYITAGQLDTSVTGLVTYDGAQFLFCYGRLMDEVNGLWFYDSAIGGDDTFYYLAGGQVVDYTGAVIYDNTFFLVENGKLSTYTGTYEYDGATFNVVNGQFYDQVA
ncbi:MAG: hypothetical protein LUH00_00210 [Lachnospiraceae bacterium]|nr:hypothetical protein [Lachnospiraceae bacterium]